MAGVSRSVLQGVMGSINAPLILIISNMKPQVLARAWAGRWEKRPISRCQGFSDSSSDLTQRKLVFCYWSLSLLPTSPGQLIPTELNHDKGQHAASWQGYLVSQFLLSHNLTNWHGLAPWFQAQKLIRSLRGGKTSLENPQNAPIRNVLSAWSLSFS